MLKHTLMTLTAIAATVVVSLAVAQPTNTTPDSTSTGKTIIRITKTSPTSGKQMYSSYCAPCHGADGKGQGPVASALKIPPTDLSTLAKNNGGKYPGSHVVTVMQFGSELNAHGSAQMPVWGPILGRMNVGNPQDKPLRISNLSRYLETIQQK